MEEAAYAEETQETLDLCAAHLRSLYLAIKHYLDADTLTLISPFSLDRFQYKLDADLALMREMKECRRLLGDIYDDEITPAEH